jgi:hypothetical protein
MIATIGGTVVQGTTTDIIPVLATPGISKKQEMENQKGEPGGSPFC